LNKVVTRALVLAAAIALSAGAAHAQGYVGATIGISATDPSLAEAAINEYNTIFRPPNYCVAWGCSVTEDSAGEAKLFGGYRFGPHFAVEGFLANLGNHVSAAFQGWSIDASVHAEVTTVGAAVVGILPFGADSAFFGKLGLHTWNVDGTYFLQTPLSPAFSAGTSSESGTDLMIGLGFDIGMAPNFALRIELESYAMDDPLIPVGVGVLSIGGLYRF